MMDWSLFGWFAGSAFVLYLLFGVRVLLGMLFAAGVGALCAAMRGAEVGWLGTMMAYALCIVVGAVLGNLGDRRGGGGIASAFGDVADVAGDLLD